MQYTGYIDDENRIHLAIIGNDVDTTVNVDLTASPFVLNIAKGNNPTGFMFKTEDGIPPTITLTQPALLTCTFDDPPPAPNPGTLSPRVQLLMFLLYG